MKYTPSNPDKAVGQSLETANALIDLSIMYGTRSDYRFLIAALMDGQREAAWTPLAQWGLEL